MKRLWIWGWLVVLVLGWAVPAALGQPGGGTALYTERVDATGRHGEVLFVGDDGALAAVPVPASFYPAGYPDAVTLGELALSPDGTKLAGTFYPQAGGNVLPLVIADLTLGACCVTAAVPLPVTYAYDLAGFSPDGSQIALAYVGEAGGAFPFIGGMMILDARTGAAAQTMPMNEAMSAAGLPGSAIWALMGEWSEDGIQWSPNCYACEGAYEGEYSLWAAHKSSFITRSGVGFSIFADRLAGTGETLYAGQSPDYPISPEPGMLPIPNVIQYLPGGALPSAASLAGAPVVFFDSASLDLGAGARWVANGSAFVVTPANAAQWALIARSSGHQPIPAGPNHRLLTGTVDGWLAVAPDGGRVNLIRYVVSGVGAFGAVIDQTAPRSDYHTAYIVLRRPPLGLGITPTPPPIVTPPAPALPTLPPPVAVTLPPAVVQCPGFMPSRLIPGQPGRVTPGDPNNLRALPDVNAAIVGRMPGGVEFIVMSGPVCDTGGRAWFQVTYNGLIGWTVEGQGNEYYTEPLPAG